MMLPRQECATCDLPLVLHPVVDLLPKKHWIVLTVQTLYWPRIRLAR